MKLNALILVPLILGLIVTLSWFMGWTWPLNLGGEDLVTMKAKTSVSFILTSLSLVFLYKKRFLVSLILALAVNISMGFQITDVHSFGDITGIPGLLISEDTKLAVHSTSPGVPSVGTMLAFIWITLGIIFHAVFNLKVWKSIPSLTFGLTTTIISVMGLWGYIIGNPLLYWEVPKYSSAMAVHTCVAMFCLGLYDFIKAYKVLKSDLPFLKG